MHRVVITGLGCISAIGNSVPAFWQAIQKGNSGIGRLSSVPSELLKIPIAAQVKDFDPADYLDPERISRLDRFAQFGLVAAREAVNDAGLTFDRESGRRCAVILGSGVGGIVTLDESFRRLYVEGKLRLNPVTIARIMMNAAVSAVSMTYGITGPCFAVSSACSSANHAVSQAFSLVRSGSLDVAITGGSEAALTEGHMKAWESLRLVANDTCRPFCLGRKGLVLGEGAGVLVLESLDHAQTRKAQVYAELVGCGISSDASDLMCPEAAGAVQAMEAALSDGGLGLEEIDYINAHGTGTVINDVTETQAIHRVFGSHAGRIAVSSTKSMHGHALGATGGLEAVATVKAIADGIMPPTANYTLPDPECNLDYVPNQARRQKIDAALSNSFAFGGLNAVLAFKRLSPAQDK